MSLFSKNHSLTPRKEPGLTPWSMWQREMSDLFDRFNRDFGVLDSSNLSNLYPKIEVKEKDKEIIVCAEVPGMDDKDVNITLRDGNLILEGERKTQKNSEDEGRYHSEFSYGSFYRSIPLGEDIKEDTVKASYKDGLLTIELEKSGESQSRVKKIPITRS